ncbi:MAG: 3-dehydroquinate synthase [Eubacteriales bacterium]|nr:3-dehydroquinate synthase [Eubacteriales bacterium]
MRTIRVNLDKNSYDIIFDNTLDELRKFMSNYKKVVLVTDQNVDKHYGQLFTSAITAKLVLPSGESTKSQESLFWLYDQFINLGVTRDDLIVAFGGGVIGDLTGYASATFMRGVPYIQVPTTLLAQVDSSVGGKTAIDMPQAKNIVGAFYQPKAVFINTNLLATLPKRVYNDGMAEVIKYGVIRDIELFNMLGQKDLDHEEIVYRCCDIKRLIVERDQFDTGERMLLNFGHTLGHVVEQFYNYKRYTHGEAVAIGMYTMAKIGVQMGITSPGTPELIKAMLSKYKLPHHFTINPNIALNIFSLDKKSQGDMINIIIPKAIGQSTIMKVNKIALFQYLKNL